MADPDDAASGERGTQSGVHRLHRSPLRLVSRGFGVVATLVSMALFAVSAYAWSTFQNIDKGIQRLSIQVDPPAQVTSGPAAFEGEAQNILLVGNDDRTNMTDAEVRELKVGRDGGSMATDTMMILHVPADGSRATLISLPRDSYVAIPGHSMNRLNAAYVDGYNDAPDNATPLEKRSAGANLLKNTVQQLTGIPINHYVQISLLGFYEVSKAIGGVPINLCHAVDDTVAHNRAEGQDGGSGFTMSAGPHTISGVQALEFVRQRHNLPLGDLDRVRRQQYFLTSAFRQVASIGIITELNALGDALKRNVYLDPSLDLLDLARQMENLTADNIVGKTIPFERFDDNSPVGSVEIIDPARVRRFVARTLAPAKTGGGHHARHHSGNRAAPDSKCVN